MPLIRRLLPAINRPAPTSRKLVGSGTEEVPASLAKMTPKSPSCSGPPGITSEIEPVTVGASVCIELSNSMTLSGLIVAVKIADMGIAVSPPTAMSLLSYENRSSAWVKSPRPLYRWVVESEKSTLSESEPGVKLTCVVTGAVASALVFVLFTMPNEAVAVGMVTL